MIFNDVFKKLFDYHKYISSTLDTREVLLRVLKYLGNVAAYDRGIAVLKCNNEFMPVLFCLGDDCDSWEYPSLESFEYDMIDKVMVESNIWVDYSPHSCLFYKKAGVINTSMGIPIIHEDNILGVILLESCKPKAFVKHVRELVYAFVGQAGTAIRNAELYNETVRVSNYVKSLLDNSDQGFFTFGDDLVISGEYSVECVNIFGKDILGTKFSEIIYNDVEKRSWLEAMLRKILDMDCIGLRELYYPLLPGEIHINGKYIGIKYKVISSCEKGTNMFMAVLTDITEKKVLENKVEEERKALRMVVKAVTNHEGLTRCLKDYKEFCTNEIYRILDSGNNPESVVFDILRSVHTFKGNLIHFDMVNVVKELHDFEAQLSELKEKAGYVIIDELKLFISGLDMVSWVYSDIEILKKTLGEDYFTHEKAIFVDEAKLLDIERRAKALLNGREGMLLVQDIKKLRYKPFRELLKHYPDYIQKLSEKLNKSIYPLVIEGGEFLIDIKKYIDFTGSLVHVFKNAVDHGVETPEERCSVGKGRYATIKCKIALKDNNIIVSISDDGHGIDLDCVRNIAVENNLYNSEEAAELSTKELTMLIFREYFTTRKNVSELSGRGVGLPAIMSEVEKLGGMVEVETKAGMGTKFDFIIKYED